MAVSEIELDPAGARFSAQSNDSQVLLEANSRNFVSQALSRALLVATLVAFGSGVFAWWIAGRRRLFHRPWLSSEQSVDEDDSRNAHFPLWSVAGLAVIAGAGGLLLFLGARLVGVSWDEPIHELSLEEFFRSGWFVPRGSFVEGIPSVADASVYAPVGALVAHFLGALTGAQPWFEASFVDQAYQARHIAVALMSIVGLAAVAAIARLLFKSWRWALLAVALSVSIPLFLGHSMFNIKDAPVAAAFSLLTLGLVVMSVRVLTRRVLLLATLSQIAAVVLGLGNRPGIWVAFVASWSGTVLLLAINDARTADPRRALALGAMRVASIAVAVVVGYAILWVIYPVAFDEPFALLRDSLLASQAFPWSGETLTAGSLMPAQPPWTYVPLWLGAQLPLVVSVFALVGLVSWAIAYLRALRMGRGSAPWVRGAIPVVLQATVVPVGAVVLGATLYGGVRQFLFMFPAVAIVSALGIHEVISALERLGRRWVTNLVWVGVLIGLIVPLVSQIRLFPYNFAYFNAVASTSDIDRTWDVDGWWLSGRELVEGQQFPARTICVDSQSRPITDCSRMGMITPFLSEFGNSDVMLAEDQYVALSRFPEGFGVDQCTPFREVTRGLFLQEIQLSHADVCTVSLAPYPEGGLSFSGLTNDDPVVLWGWNPYLLWGWGQPDADGVWMVEPEASVGFTASVLLEETVTEVEITGSGSTFGAEGGSLRVFVNGVDAGTIPLPGEGQSQTSRVVMPEGAFAELGNGRVVIRLQAEGVDPLALDAAIDTGAPGLFRIERLALQ